MSRVSFWPNRTLCAVLDGMRKCNETRNYAALLSLIEEAQLLGDRMEAGLENKDSMKTWLKEKSKIKKEIRALEAKRDKLLEEKNDRE